MIYVRQYVNTPQLSVQAESSFSTVSLTCLHQTPVRNLLI